MKQHKNIVPGLMALYVMAASLSDEAKAQVAPRLTNSISNLEVSLEPERKSIWEHGIGEGVRAGAESVEMSIGGNYGVPILGGRESHHLALVTLSYGLMLGPVQGEGHWYRGNWELRGELFSGAQFSPEREWFIGLTPHLRYNFATGTRWIPFADAGAGVTATGIAAPDLSGTFEFNLEAGVGLHLFLKDNVALTVEARYAHWSCAGISYPNFGLNGITGLVGLTLFF